MDDARRALIHDLNDILELQLMAIALKTWPIWADYWKKRGEDCKHAEHDDWNCWEYEWRDDD